MTNGWTTHEWPPPEPGDWPPLDPLPPLFVVVLSPPEEPPPAPSSEGLAPLPTVVAPPPLSPPLPAELLLAVRLEPLVVDPLSLSPPPPRPHAASAKALRMATPATMVLFLRIDIISQSDG